jgi:hypothetical protein
MKTGHSGAERFNNLQGVTKEGTVLVATVSETSTHW